MSNEKIKQEIVELAHSTRQRQFDLINEHYGEKDLYSFSDEQIVFYANPYHGEVWNILKCLEAIDGIGAIHVNFTSDKDDDYDMVTVDMKGEW